MSTEQFDNINEELLNMDQETPQNNQEAVLDLNLGGEAPKPKEKKKMDPKKKKKIILIISSVVAAVIAICLVVGFVFFDLAHIIEFGWVKLTRDDKGAAMYVEERALEEDEAVITALTALYKNLAQKNASHTRTDLSLDINSVVTELLGQYADPNSAIALLLQNTESIQLTLDTNDQTHANKTDITLGVNETELLTAETYVDFENGVLYLGSDDVSKETLAFDLKNMEEGIPSLLLAMVEAIHEGNILSDKLPSEKAFKEMAKEYILIAYRQIDDVEESTEKVTVDGVKQTFTLYTYTIDEETIKDICIAWLKETQKNKTMQQLLRAFYDDAQAFDEIMKEIPEAIKSMQKEDLDLGEDIILETYVDITGKVCGRSCGSEDTVMWYLTTAHFNKQATKIQILSEESDILFIGQGKSDDLVEANGEYQLKVNGQKICKASLKKYSLTKGTGSIILTLDQKFSQELLQDYGLSNESALSMLEIFSPRIEIQLKEKSQKVKLSLGGQHIFSLDIATKDLKEEDIQMPMICTPAEDFEDIRNWFLNGNLITIGLRLQKAGLGGLIKFINIT